MTSTTGSKNAFLPIGVSIYIRHRRPSLSRIIMALAGVLAVAVGGAATLLVFTNVLH